MKVLLLTLLILCIGCQIHYFQAAPIPSTKVELKEYISSNKESLKTLEVSLKEQKEYLDKCLKLVEHDTSWNTSNSKRVSRIEFKISCLENEIKARKTSTAKAEERLKEIDNTN